MDLKALTESAWELFGATDSEALAERRVRRRTQPGSKKIVTTSKTSQATKLKAKRSYRKNKVKLKLHRKKSMRSVKFRRRIKWLAKRAAARKK